MESMLPFPSFTANDPTGKLRQIETFLWQLREHLELALTDIGVDNFSPAFRMELEAIGVQMESAKTNAEESQQRVERVSNEQLTVSDVLNSEAYKKSIEAAKKEVVSTTASCITFQDGTRIEYGSISQSEAVDVTVTFAEPYLSTPFLMTSPYAVTTITATGFTVNTDGMAWIAIGKIEIKEEE